MNPKVDEFLSKAPKWGKEMEQLRMIVLDCGLTEDFKWKQPCYTVNKKNVVIISALKDGCVLSFFKGVLLKDDENILQKPGANSQSGRYAKFASVKEIIEKELILKAYIHQAIEVEKQGLKVEKKESENLDFPEELIEIFNKKPAFKKAFEALTPGRQRGYNMFFAAAKQAATRTARIQKYYDRIMDGYGIHDCVCGMSKKMPTCDGSHKYL